MKFSVKQWILIGVAAVAIIVVVCLATGIMERNDVQNYQIVQALDGEVYVRSEAGWYMKNFAKVWTYPRAVQCYFSEKTDEGGTDDQSIRVTFNDGGQAMVSTMVRFQLPTAKENQIQIHQNFNNDMEALKHAVRAHLTNCIKATGPLMSASEHQSARKAEFTQLVEKQLRNGLYKMRKVEKELKDRTDEKGKPITVYATEIVEDKDGMPAIAQISPLMEYNIQILQFSVTETEYDPQTLKQFATKKESYLAAEQSKAEREQEVQQRLMVIEKGLREKAEVEATANKLKATAVIAAELKAEVALQTKLEAETAANQLLSVAKIQKEAAETKANQELEVARTGALAAEENAKAVKTLASAEEERIKKAGAITEKEQILAEIDANMRAKIATAIAQVDVPSTMIIGGGAGGKTQITESLLNVALLERLGMIDPAPAKK